MRDELGRSALCFWDNANAVSSSRVPVDVVDLVAVLPDALAVIRVASRLPISGRGVRVRWAGVDMGEIERCCQLAVDHGHGHYAGCLLVASGLDLSLG